MEGFFDIEDTHAETQKTVSACGSCGLYKYCKSPKMKTGGEGRKKILIIAEAPGETEDEKGTQLIGKAGRLLEQHLRNLDINLHDDCWKINAVSCRPRKNKTPDAKQIEACRPRVLKAVTELKPKLIILLGSCAIKSFYGHRWKKDLGGITKWRGWQIPDREIKAWVCPTFHPSYVQRCDVKHRNKTYNPAEVIFGHDLEKAIGMLEEPFPIFKEEKVEILYNKLEIIQRLKQLIRLEPTFLTVDFETTGLKPHRKEQEIVTCAFTWKRNHAIAFVVTDSLIPYMRTILKNKSKKIIGNLKFEQLWSRVKLKQKIKRIYHDVVECAHVLRNTDGITSVKFQVCVRLGVIDYNQFIAPKLRADKKGGNELNRIKEININSLLKYNGLDTIYEHEIAIQQMKELENATA